MQSFTKITAVAAPLDLANIDTDKIIPARFLRRLREPGYEKLAFHDIRYDADGKDRPDFVLNQAPYKSAKILVAGANFGCGSSREAAVYVMWDYGIRSVIAPSFGDIHYGNELQNGMLPVTLPWFRNSGIEYISQLSKPLTETGPFYTDVQPFMHCTPPSGTTFRVTFGVEPC